MPIWYRFYIVSMIFCTPNIRRALVWALLLSLPMAAAAKPLYRYRNAEGNVVVGFQVPVESVRGGYEVLNKDGMVIKVVPPELSSEERRAKDAELKREQEAREEQERLRKWDESLMLRYSTVEDIEDAKRRALSDLQIRVSILRGNRRSIKQQVENYQAQAANTERAGGSVHVERLREIEGLQEAIDNTERDIAARELEIEELSTSYDNDIERFGMLQEVVQLRQSMSNRKK